MDEHDGLDPTVAMPRIDATSVEPAPHDLPPQPIPVQRAGPPVRDVRARAQPSMRGPYVFGNPLGYVVRRFLAVGLDFVVVTSAATMMLYALIAINPFSGLPNNSEGGFDATLAMGVGITVLYVWLAEGIFGTTLGKLAFALHVYPVKGRFVGLGRAFTRSLLRPVDALAIGFILAILPGHRRLGDIFGGTVVAHSPLRAFSPLVGWLLVIGLCVVPFFVAGGTVTVLAVAAAFVQFVPPLVARAVHGLLLLLQSGVHLRAGISSPPTAGPSAASAPG